MKTLKITLLALLTITLTIVFTNCNEKSTEPKNNAPKIESVSASPSTLKVNETTSLSCVAKDEDGDKLTYNWSSEKGTFPNGVSGSSVSWKAPEKDGKYEVEVIVSDGKKTDKAKKSINVVLQNGNLEGYVYQINTTNTISGVLVEAGEKSYTTGSDGYYRIDDISSGTVTVKATKSDYEVYQQTVNITANQTEGHNIYMKILSTNISGNVLDKDTKEPISNVKITVGGQVDYTDTNGHYQLSNVPQGLQTIIGKKKNYVTFKGEVLLSSSNKVFDIALQKNYSPCPGTETVTYGGQTYNTVQIGDQCWFKENLNIGTMIESNAGGYLQTDNGVIEKYCYYNDENNCTKYGGLYEWTEAMQYITTEGTQGICPNGWHIPTRAEFKTLESYVNDEAVKLIDAGENMSGYIPTNETGFSALIAGWRWVDGYFYDLGQRTYFWSSTEYDNNYAYYMRLLYNYSDVYMYNDNGLLGFSVRCLKD